MKTFIPQVILILV